MIDRYHVANSASRVSIAVRWLCPLCPPGYRPAAFSPTSVGESQWFEPIGLLQAVGVDVEGEDLAVGSEYAGHRSDHTTPVGRGGERQGGRSSTGPARMQRTG